jgi:hypothetical protein
VADRSYLYSTDHLPGSAEWSAKRMLQGIAEYRYDIPLAFKLLLTADPVACPSSIWETPAPVAIAGDYARGVANLTTYLGRITDPAARPLIDETIRFLGAPEHARRYFVLECGEIFDLTKGPLDAKNAALVAEIQELGSAIDELPVPQPAPARPGLLGRMLGLKAPDPLLPYYELGLGAWSELLYFDFSQGEA